MQTTYKQTGSYGSGRSEDSTLYRTDDPIFLCGIVCLELLKGVSDPVRNLCVRFLSTSVGTSYVTELDIRIHLRGWEWAGGPWGWGYKQCLLLTKPCLRVLTNFIKFY